MKKIQVKQLKECDFSKYGRYVNLMEPDSPYIGESPVRFYRDMMPLGGNETLSLSITLAEPRGYRVDVMEFHTGTGECFLSLDGDTYICVGPATAGREPVIEEMEGFFVPAGTAVYIHPGVWHFAPFPAEEKAIHSLVLLPQRTYANDCVKYEIPEEEMPELDL